MHAHAAVRPGGHPSFDVDAHERADARSPGVEPAAALANRELALPGLVLVGVATWCALVMCLGLSFADSFWDGLWIAAFGVPFPLILLRHATRFLESYQRARETNTRASARDETLQLLMRYGYLTPTMAAARSSLTLDEAAATLADLALTGRARVMDQDGGPLYALVDAERRTSDAVLAWTPAHVEGIEPAASNKARADADGELPDPQVRGQEEALGAGAHVADEIDQPPRYTPRPRMSGLSIVEALSERELEVLALLASGRSNREIANELVVAIGTVKTHTNNLYRKLSARNRAEALAVARELSLV